MVRAHDHVIDFCEMEGQRLNVTVSIHSRFLDEYFQPRTTSNISMDDEFDYDTATREWWTLTSERHDFLINRLVNILARAEHVRELAGLLSRAEWAALRLKCGGFPSLMNDFNISISAVSKRSRSKISEALKDA